MSCNLHYRFILAALMLHRCYLIQSCQFAPFSIHGSSHFLYPPLIKMDSKNRYFGLARIQWRKLIAGCPSQHPSFTCPAYLAHDTINKWLDLNHHLFLIKYYVTNHNHDVSHDVISPMTSQYCCMVIICLYFVIITYGLFVLHYL